MMKIIDPYFYRHRIQIPKLIINAAGDEYEFDNFFSVNNFVQKKNCDVSLDSSCRTVASSTTRNWKVRSILDTYRTQGIR